MNEKLTTINTWEAELMEYMFRSKPEERSEYEQRGLLLTNNLSLWLTDPVPEIYPGIPNPWYYPASPYASVIEDFKNTNAEMWEKGRAAAIEKHERQSRISELFNSGKSEDMLEFSAASQDRIWQNQADLTEFLRAIAPALIEAGFHPLELCK